MRRVETTVSDSAAISEQFYKHSTQTDEALRQAQDEAYSLGVHRGRADRQAELEGQRKVLRDLLAQALPVIQNVDPECKTEGALLAELCLHITEAVESIDRLNLPATPTTTP